MNAHPPHPPSAPVPPTRGLVAGKYQLNRLIGKGGMGSVWEGQHFKLGTKVAIKFIETEHAVSAEARSRFEKEAMAAATIQSKHAIQIFDHGVTDESIPYIVMEMLVGESLERRVDRVSRMSVQETAKILLQVSRALARAHDRGIIHRDLKPDNIFIVRDVDDGEEMAKVLDFGIAKMQGGPGNPGMTSSTKTGAVLGTPFYMSPEQARGLRGVDHRTDVWSLGVIAYRCITGRLPFDGESVGDLLVKICTAPVPVPSQVVAGIPPGFDQWFLRAMEREPDRRFGAVLEQANELCFVAGLATPGHGAPGSHQPQTVHSGHATPNGSRGSGPHAPAASGYGQNAPMTQPSPSHGSNPSQPGYAAAAPAGVTNAPFTSEHVSGLPQGGKGKVVGIALGAVAVLALLASAGYALSKRQTGAAPIAAISSAPPPPASTVVPESSATAAAKTDPKPIASAATKEKDPAPTEHKPGSGKAVPAPKPNPLPQPVAKPAPAPPPPPPPLPAPLPSPKPKNNDPGY